MQELENWFELLILVLALTTLSLKQEMDTLQIVSSVGTQYKQQLCNSCWRQNSGLNHERAASLCIAVYIVLPAICLAWLELIFLFGRYPFLGGSFSIMYYSITKRIVKVGIS